MKKILFVLIGLFILTTAVARKIPGTIIYKTGGAIDVVFNVPFKFLSSNPNYERMQYRIVYYDASNKKMVLKPGEAEEIRFAFGGQEIIMLSRPNTLGAGSLFSNVNYIFLRLQIDGKMKLFNYYFSQSSPGMYSPATGGMGVGHTYTVENYVLQKEDGALVQPRGLTFRKDMTEYFRDCPELVNRIQERELRRGDLEIIVMEYNKKCGY